MELKKNLEEITNDEYTKTENSIEIAKNMLKDNINLSIISKYTGLTIEEINKIEN